MTPASGVVAEPRSAASGATSAITFALSLAGNESPALDIPVRGAISNDRPYRDRSKMASFLEISETRSFPMHLSPAA